MRCVRLVLFSVALVSLPALPLASPGLSAQQAAAAGEDARIAVTVRVYQSSRLQYRFGQRARTEAERLLRSAQVHVVWMECVAVDPDPACRARPGVSELVLRVVDDGTPDQSTSLGTALVVPHATGLFATLYSGRVTRIANETDTEAAVLLGRVAAHELGHLLMNTTGHGRRGLMRPTWTRREIARNRAEDWAFTTADMAAMRQPAP